MNIDLKFQDWALVLQRANVRQYDDRAHTLRVTGDLPAGWRWTMYLSVFSEAYFNAVALTESDGALTAVLTRGDLAFGDTAYTLQLVGTKDDVRRHTNPVRLYVGASLSGDGVWPEVPRSFTDAETAALDAAARAEQAAAGIETAAEELGDLTELVTDLAGGMTDHVGNSAIHITAAERAAWNAKANALDLEAHATDTDKHLTARERAKWNGYGQTLEHLGVDLDDHTSAAALHLPAGGSAGDFLRRTAGGAAWQTVPAAEGGAF